MKKITLTTCFMLLAFLKAASAEEPTASPFPNAKPGINIMPMAEIAMPKEMKSQFLITINALKSKGYDDTAQTDESVLSLLNISHSAKDEINKFDNDPNPYDTHLKSSFYKIKLGFNFRGIPGIDNKNVIGYAAAGGYKQGKGWDGIVEFISDEKLGVCSYTTYAIEKVILDKETTEYLVNKKPSNKSIAGNKNTGFLYTINWYTSNRLMSLECANKMLEPALIKNMIDLANNIDIKNQ